MIWMLASTLSWGALGPTLQAGRTNWVADYQLDRPARMGCLGGTGFTRYGKRHRKSRLGAEGQFCGGERAGLGFVGGLIGWQSRFDRRYWILQASAGVGTGWDTRDTIGWLYLRPAAGVGWPVARGASAIELVVYSMNPSQPTSSGWRSSPWEPHAGVAVSLLFGAGPRAGRGATPSDSALPHRP